MRTTPKAGKNPREVVENDVRRQKRPSPRVAELGARASYKRAGRWMEKPNAEHEIVLRAAGIANRALGRAVCTSEVIKALTPREVNTLRAAYALDLGLTVSKVLGLLCARGCVFSAGKLGTRHFYGVVGVLDPATGVPPDAQSRRARVLGLVRAAVEALGRSVRMCDILEHAAKLPEVSGLKPLDITIAVMSLKHEGELRHVGSVRGDGKGINLYLPAELDPKDYPPPRLLTRIEEVAHAFGELWAERESQASAEGRKPYPLSTGEIRIRLRTSAQHHEHFSSPMIIVNSMQQLAKSENPTVRKVRRPNHRAVLWAPAGVADSELNAGDAYASNAERMVEAVRRAEDMLGRPVTQRDVRDQIDRDPCLLPDGTSRLFSILSEAAKETIAAGKNGGRRGRMAQRIRRVGKVADMAYYSARGAAEGEAFIKFKRLELWWSAARAGEEIEALDLCSLPGVAVGRALLIIAEITEGMTELEPLHGGRRLQAEQRQRADEMRAEMSEALDLARAWLKDHAWGARALPRDVNTAVPGLTADELLEIIRPLYPTARTLSNSSKLVGLKGHAIRRIPNPDYSGRFPADQRAASEYLFDRADALIYTAKEWGGYECCLQATLAGNELGRLRDRRFVLPALDGEDFNSRLAAVACLAFLGLESCEGCLRRLVFDDPDPGVRQSALWAYGFAGGADARELLVSRSKDDKDRRVRTFARDVLNAGLDSWWSL